MLVLISFGLVLVATVLLVLGLVASDGLGLIYVSIACSLAAGIVLIVATRVNRPRLEGAAAPTPLPPPDVPETVPAATVATPVADAAFAPATREVAAVGGAVDDMFPIADYDDLTVGEIVPLLPKLYADEIDVVEVRERDGKSRRQILARLAELRESLADAPDDVTAEEWEEQQEAAPARRAPAKKVVKKAPARKAAPATRTTKKAPTAKRPAAKKAAAKKTTAKKTTAKKAAPARKAPAKKAAAKKTGAKKAAPAKKAAKKTTKKATKATKKATKRR